MRIIFAIVGIVALSTIHQAQTRERQEDLPISRCGCQAGKPDENVLALNNLSETIARFIQAKHNPMMRDLNSASTCYAIADSIRKGLRSIRIPENMHKHVLSYIAKHILQTRRAQNKATSDEINIAVTALATSLSQYMSMTIEQDLLEDSSKKAGVAIAESIKHNLGQANIPTRKHKNVLNAIAQYLSDSMAA